jgi:hypothetical protein
MTQRLLPDSSWMPLTTRRLRQPRLLWQSPEANSAGFDPEQVYCCPKDYEAATIYGDEMRQEWADRYGGIGVGGAGGSGRCSTFQGLQTKGVGVTPLVAADADANHSSGTLMLVEAALEALYAAVYQMSLPYGAVPVHALVWTGGSYTRRFDHNDKSPCLRTLVVRPYTPRPAHFMRNLLHRDGRLPAGVEAPGQTRDAWRTMQAMSCLAVNFKVELRLDTPQEDEAACLDAGFKELARRYAWQAAASFAKRLPHGTLSASNIALSGAYLDYGLSSFVPSYRRLSWPPTWQDPWTEPQVPIQTLATLRQQLDKYRPQMREAPIISIQNLAADYQRVLAQRLAVEMAKMAGLTEDMALACPADLLDTWFKVMREIWTRGAGEQFVHYSGSMVNGAPTPPPRSAGRYDLNLLLPTLWQHAGPDATDQALAPSLTDPTLRARLIHASQAVQASLVQWAGVSTGALQSYLARQAQRKNASLEVIQRDTYAHHPAFGAFEAAMDVDHVGATIDTLISEARRILCDLDPELPGPTGQEQLRASLT